VRHKDLSFDLFANVPPTEIFFRRDKPMKILTHGNGFHYVTKGTKIFICPSDKFTDIFDPKQDKYIKKLISPYRIAYNFSGFDIELHDFAKESWREEAMLLIQKAKDKGADEVEIPNFFEKEWLKNRRLRQ